LILRFTYDYNNGDIKASGNITNPKGIAEGWGLTNTDNELIWSDGSDRIYLLNEKFEVIRNLTVYSITNGKRVTYEKLNELEYVNGKLFSNVWTTDKILMINPGTGEVLKVINFAKLIEYEGKLTSLNRFNDVLNGIAFDKYKNR
jgi:glutamine cyclotransferase